MHAAPLSGCDNELAPVQTVALAVDGLVEQAPGCLGFPYRFVQFPDLGSGDYLPARANRTAVREKGSNFLESKADILIQGDEPQLVNGIQIVSALLTQTCDWREQTDLLVVTQRGRTMSAAVRQCADRQKLLIWGLSHARYLTSSLLEVRRFSHEQEFGS